jgi:UDP-glucuronate 4-epimerase
MKTNKILVTGCCGFIGYHLCSKLTLLGFNVVGIDNLIVKNKELQLIRLKNLRKKKLFSFYKFDLADKKKLSKINGKFPIIIHLAAKPGVRESFNFPDIYFSNNIQGFFNIIEFARTRSTKVFMYASSSSVYGNNQKKNIGTIEKSQKLQPLSFYALTKEINESIASFMSKTYNFKSFGLRFFSVYGPYGRPDMAYYKFPLLIIKNKFIQLNNYGKDFRDFTHVDDVVNGIVKLLKKSPKINGGEIFNFGSNSPTKIKSLVDIIQNKLKIKVKIKNKAKNKFDPKITNADIKYSNKIFNYEPKINFQKGYNDFLDWFLMYHKK